MKCMVCYQRDYCMLQTLETARLACKGPFISNKHHIQTHKEELKNDDKKGRKKNKKSYTG